LFSHLLRKKIQHMRKRNHLKLLFLLCLFGMGAGSAMGQTTVCPGTQVYLTAGTYRGLLQWQSSTDGGITWNNIVGATGDTAVVAPTDSVWYRAMITEGNCNPVYSDTSTVVISNLAADAGPDVAYCVSAVTIGGTPAAIGGTSPYTYSWSPGTGLSSTTTANPQATPTVPTTYTLTVTDAMGCVATDDVVVDTGSGIPYQDSVVFVFTGAAQTFVIPACVDSVRIRTWGAQGENALVGGATGGLGGYAEGRLNVTLGETLHVYVGGQSGFNGGGAGGINGNDQFSGPPIGTFGGDGGGASDVRQGGTALGNRVIVAGGGGGAGHNGVWPGCQTAGPGGNGGAGGGSTGGSGTFGVGTPCNCGGGGGDGGLGGSQVAGGTAGAYAGSTACLRSSWSIGFPGALGVGGAGATTYHNGSGGGGGGGGGYYGGGSGGNGSDTTPGGGGGGGSSYTTGLGNGSTTSGVRTGDGRIVIYY
jgi:hypothetical protein